METSPCARATDETTVLAAGELHLWRVRLADDADAARTLLSHLAPDERARAESLRPGVQRTRFILARAHLRSVLRRYEPAAHRAPFHYSAKGKPSLPRADLHFSLSHAGALVLFGFARSPVGVDVEQERPRAFAAALARRFFPPHVRALLDAAEPATRARLFLRAWTQREAAVKALGRSVYDRSVELPFDLSRSALARCEAGGEAWSVVAVDPWPDAIAAAALPAPVHLVRYWDAPALE